MLSMLQECSVAPPCCRATLPSTRSASLSEIELSARHLTILWRTGQRPYFGVAEKLLSREAITPGGSRPRRCGKRMQTANAMHSLSVLGYWGRRLQTTTSSQCNSMRSQDRSSSGGSWQSAIAPEAHPVNVVHAAAGGRVEHEIEWWRSTPTGTSLIEAADVEHLWLPRA